MKKELTQKVLIINPGDSALEVGAHVSINTVNDMNKSLEKDGKFIIKYENINLTRDEIALAINNEIGLTKKECLDIVNDLVEIIILGLTDTKIVKIHNFGTFKLKRKNSRIGRNPRTKEEKLISERNVITFKPSKNIIKLINSNNNK